MKATLPILALLISLGAFCRALDIVTPEATFKDVKVTKVEAEAVRITHSEGTALVDFDFLPPAMQAEYGWSAEKSAARKAAKEAEIKRLEEEEKMLDEAPKRKAMEAEAKKKADEDRVAADERARMRLENSEFEAETEKAQKELLDAAAKARADIDRERGGKMPKPGEVPVATIVEETPADASTQTAPRVTIVTPAVGSVADAIGRENPLLENPKVWIGLVVGLILVVVLFMMAGGNKPKIPVKVPRRR